MCCPSARPRKGMVAKEFQIIDINYPSGVDLEWTSAPVIQLQTDT